jgi:hypothetical protein
MVLARLSTDGMRVNASKSKFFAEQIEYLVYWITRQVVQPVHSKLEALLNIKAPKIRKELRQFIGIVNYYCNMWICRSELLGALTSLTSSKVKLNCFQAINRLLTRSSRSLELSYFYVTQVSVNHSTFILMSLIISWVQLLCRINAHSLLFTKAQHSPNTMYNFRT